MFSPKPLLKVWTMKLGFLFVVALALGLAESAASYDRVAEHRNWTRAGPHQGFNEYYLHGPKNSRIELLCGPADSETEGPEYIATVSFAINGASSPDGLVTLMVDGRKFLLRDRYGTGKESTPCPECSKLAEFWRAARVSKTVEMRLTDGRRVRFNSKGGDKILGNGLCEGAM